jgi:pilus assembly protein CpaE
MENAINVMAIVRTRDAEAALRHAWQGMNGTPLRVMTAAPGSLPFDLGARGSREVLLLDLDPSENDHSVALVQRMSRQFPDQPIVVTARDVTVTQVRELMRLGVVDVLPHPWRPEDLIAAFDLATRQRRAPHAAPERRGRVVSLLKGGRGVGASMLAVEGGSLLARTGAASGRRVALLDFDLQFGTCGIYLDLAGQASLADLLASPERLDRSLLQGAMAHHKSGLDVLLSPASIMPMDSVAPNFAAACVEIARQSYDLVIIDLPCVWTAWSYEVLQRSDLMMLVTQLSVASVRHAGRQLETLRAQGLDSIPLKMVLNRHEGGWGLGRSAHVKDAEKALGRAFDHQIADNYRLVSEALNRGVGLAAIERRSRVERDVEAMFNDVAEKLAASAAHDAAAMAAV